MEHQFNTELAEKYGVIPAIILHNFVFWIIKNEANDKHFHEGRYWTYNSNAALSELFPYLSSDQIRRSIEKLTDEGILKKGNYNSSAYDRTLWYSVDETILSIYRKPKLHLATTPNGNGSDAEPIPDSKPDSKPDNKDPKNNFSKFDFLKNEKLVYNAEEEILAHRAQFEIICMVTSKSEEVARDSLHLFHLWLEENEKYPKSRKSIFAGFEKWLLNEKKFNYGNDRNKTNGNATNNTNKLGAKSGGFAILTEALEQLKSGGFAGN